MGLETLALHFVDALQGRLSNLRQICTIPELLENVKIVIQRCNKYNVILSAAKTKFGLREAPFFGYILGNGVYKINPERQAAIARIEAAMRKLRRFLEKSARFKRNKQAPHKTVWVNERLERCRQELLRLAFCNPGPVFEVHCR